jgi:hypothetical protein
MKSDHLKNVFINCPFDEEYAPLLRAVVFAVIDSGFTPRCALERNDSGQVRIQKIYQIISECTFGIHDLSRNSFGPKSGLPRFNMPLELGIYLGAKFLGRDQHTEKQCLIFDEQPHKYSQYISDVAGQDIATHGAEPKQALRCIRDWLSQASNTHVPTGSYVWDRYLTFLGELTRECSNHRQNVDELTYNDLLKHVQTFRSNYVEKLDIGGDGSLPSPTAQQVRAAIKRIERENKIEDPFIILSKGANGLTYLQAFRGSVNAWTLEYQVGDTLQHFMAVGEQTMDRVTTCFTKYLEADPSWQAGMEWVPIDVE